MEFAAAFLASLVGAPLAVKVAVGLPVGLVAAVLLVVKASEMLAASKAAAQATEFQGKLIAAFDALRASETAVREQLDQAEAENTGLRDNVDALRETLTLIRGQRHHLIRLLQDIRDGRLAPADIPVRDLDAA